MAHDRYSPVAAILHWTIAALIIGQIAGGWYMHQLPNASPIKFDLYQLHKSFGVSILALALFRLGWRLTHKTPSLPAGMPKWEKIAARAVHWAFYALMILTPLAGLAIVSVSPTEIPTKWFGLIPIPHLPFFGGETSRALEDVMKDRHEFLAFSILYLLGLHVAAALKHQFFNKDGVMRSMLPAKKRYWMGAGAIVAVLAAGALFYLAAPGPRAAAAGKTIPEHSHDGDDAHAPQPASPANDAPQPAGTGHRDDHDHSSDAAHESGASKVAAADAPREAGAADIRPVSNVWTVDYSASSLKFIGSESGAPFEGSFSNFEALIVFDPDEPATASITVTISTASARTGNELRDSSLPGGEWFDVKNHPSAIFRSTAARAAGDGYEADGSLTIKNFKTPVTLAFDLAIDGDNAVATGGADLLRTDFGLGDDPSWLNDEGLADEVRVEFEIHATRAN